jgi:two-component sensor histidine kinase
MQVPSVLIRLRGQPAAIRYLLTLAVVTAVLALRLAASSLLPPTYPVLHFFLAIILCALLFDRGSGFVAVGFSAAYADYFFMDPVGSLALAKPSDLIALVLFMLIGATTAMIIEAQHRAARQLATANARLQQAHAEVSRSGRQKELLLRDFGHRVRNDLQLLAGLLILQSRTFDGAARAAFEAAAERVGAMARVHDHLAPADGDGVRVDIGAYLQDLCAAIVARLAGLRTIALQTDLQRGHLFSTSDAVWLGLIANELLTNSLKYAFPDERSGCVTVRLEEAGGVLALTIGDDGIGFTGGAAASGTGIGLSILPALAGNLAARLVPLQPPRGTAWRIELPPRGTG